jgi:chromate transporter
MALAVAAFVALTVFAVPFPVVVGVAAIAGWGLARVAPAGLAAGSADPEGGRIVPTALIPDDTLHAEVASRSHTVKVLVTGLACWGIPMGVVLALAGTASVFTEQGLFFTGAALVTFGGAYAVLAYVAQNAVEVYGWLGPGEMVRGLALAETTPGPLIMVVQFVAFVGAYRDPGSLNPWIAAVLAALLTTWVTFVPAFVLVLVGAPYVERLRGHRSLTAALTGITAAVVGVIANLGVYFALHTLFAETRRAAWGPASVTLPEVGSLRPVALAVAAAAFVMLFRLRWSVLRTLGACAALGLAAAMVGLPVR